MTFLQPYILWALPLLLVPVIIHLVNRLRHRPQPWAAMRFLRSASQSSINQAKLRQWLVLLFRVLAVAALIFFLSRPLVGGWLGWALSPAPEVVLLVLDRSASMEARLPGGKTRREQAISLFMDGLREFEGAARVVLLDSATRAPQELPGLAALGQESFTGRTDTAADLPALLTRAYNYLVKTKAGAAEVWIASDLQASNWLPEDSRWRTIVSQFSSLPQKVRFRLLSLNEPPPANTTVTLVEALRRRRGGQPELAVALDLQRLGQSSAPLVLNASINGAGSEYRIDLADPSLRWRQVIPLAGSAQTGWGKIEAAADGNSSDNSIFFVFEPEREVHALVVSSEPGGVLPLAAADFSGEQLEPAPVIPPREFEESDLARVAMIAWHADLPSGTAADKLAHFVHNGGVAIFFPVEGAGGQSFAGLGWGQIVPAPEGGSFSVDEWNSMDGPLARTEEGLELPLQTLEVRRRAAIAGPATPLATFDDGGIFLARQPAGDGMIYFCATAPVQEWSSLQEGYIFVPMIQRLHSDGARRLNSAVFVDCGEPIPDAPSWETIAGAGEDPRIHAGVYRGPQGLLAVNRPAREDAIQTLAPDAARQLFGDLSLRLLREEAADAGRLQGEAWRFFVLAMLIFLLVEGLLLIPRAESGAARLSAPTRKPPREEALPA